MTERTVNEHREEDDPIDPQRTNFYRLDNRLEPYDEKLSEEEFIALLQRLQYQWGISRPPLEFVSPNSLTHFDPFFFRLEVAADQMSRLTALHETAHIIRYDYDLEALDPQTHGSTFARIALDLYSEYLNVDSAKLLSEAKIDCGLKVAPAGQVLPPDPDVGAGF